MPPKCGPRGGPPEGLCYSHEFGVFVPRSDGFGVKLRWRQWGFSAWRGKTRYETRYPGPDSRSRAAPAQRGLP
jgi:hypothetical protein